MNTDDSGSGRSEISHVPVVYRLAWANQWHSCERGSTPQSDIPDSI